MWKDFFSSLSLVDQSGYFIIAVIVLVAVLAFIINLSIGRYYASMEKEIGSGGLSNDTLKHRFLKRVVKNAEEMSIKQRGDFSVQALLEHRFKQDLKGPMTAERFLKSAPGLTIVLGLIGTFYGLTLAIGKLVTLIAGDVQGAAEITKTLTTGLTGALSGMSVAFSTSLFGIIASVLLVLLNVFFNLPEKRTALLLNLEVSLESLREKWVSSEDEASTSTVGGRIDARSLKAVETLGASVEKLQESIVGFDAALVGFARNTRDFQEFNLHLKDNIQRMSLTFADLSDTLKTHTRPNSSGR